MKTKKHKIKISSDFSQSGFVIDLRSKSKKTSSEIKDSSFKPKPITPNKIDNDFNYISKLDKSQNQVLKKIDNFKKDINNNKKSSFFINWSSFKKTFFFPVFLFIFKVLRAIIFFFVDWAIDIFNFLKKLVIFKYPIIFFKKIYKFLINYITKLKIKTRLKRKKKQISLPLIKETPTFKTSILETNIKTKTNKKTYSIIYFVLFLFLLIIPFKLFSYYRLVADQKTIDNLKQYSTLGLDNFISASGEILNLNLSLAQNDFFQAGQNFLMVDKKLGEIDEFLLFLSSFSKDKEIKLASESKNIAKIGIYLASAGDNFSLAINSLIAVFSENETEKNFSDFYYYTKKTEADFKKANKYLKKIDEDVIPEEYRDQFKDIKEQADVLEKSLNGFLEVAPVLKDFLGIDHDRRYLVVFQNNTELRATGGFIGSYALIDLKKGQIKNIEIPAGGSYDTEGGMKISVESPKPLHLVKSKWYFWDANWWPDWKLSAQNLMWFYEKSGGPSVDGVISLTPDVLADILEIIGPIDLTEKYGVVIDSNNFVDILQEIVEVIGQPEVYQNKNLQTDILNRVASSSKELSSTTEEVVSDGLKRNEPKKIIGDLMTIILEKTSSNLNKDFLIKLSQVIEKNLNQKNILLYFTDPNIQLEVENRLWAGRMKETSFDYLAVINSNVAGGKTDKFIKNDMTLNVEIEDDGSIVNTLTIKREHLGNKENLFSGIRNNDWMRIYTPLGSTLISATGFSSMDESSFKPTEDFYEQNSFLANSENKAEIDLLSNTKIYQESSKTVFANWSILDPGQSEIIEIKYKLPYNFKTLFIDNEPKSIWNFWKLFDSDEIIKNYSLLWQKQAGDNNSTFNFNLINNLNLSTLWTYPKNISQNDKIINFSGNLITDKYLAIIFK
ncbi:MAG TPA: DUF4012 domain-containing protein [bacterium]|nr:DUF4012 domain-containing protein [bacterium]